MNTFVRGLALVLGISLSLSISDAYSQTNEFVLDEIVVTAQKRVQTLQDVPISVSVVSGDKLVEAGIMNLDDLAPYVPNVSKSESGIGPVLQIRSIASVRYDGKYDDNEVIGVHSGPFWPGTSQSSSSASHCCRS